MPRNFASILEPLTKNWRWLIVLILVAQPCCAANHYVRAAASGNGSGGDWANACTSFTGLCAPGSLVRGDTYFVAAGTYPGVDFNTATSGTLVIVIQRATTAAHGTDTGWTNAFDGQVRFSFGTSYGVGFDTSHWVFDGVTGAGNGPGGGNSANYGFLIAQPSNCNTDPQYYITVPVNDGAGTITDITISHTASISCGVNFQTHQVNISLGDGATTLTNSTVSYNYMSQGENNISTDNLNGVILEHNWHNDIWSTSSHHGESVSMSNWQNVTVRYSVIKDCGRDGTGATGCLAAINPSATTLPNIAFYGNLFWCTTTTTCNIGNGFIATADPLAFVNSKVYNNTFVNAGGNIFMQCEAAGCPSASGNVFENNLLYNSGSSLVSNGSGAGAITHDYNSYLSSQDGGNSETHGQIANLNPFLNLASGDFHVAVIPVVACSVTSATCDGLALSSPYNVDAGGNIRGTGGIWARGTYEFINGVSSLPNPPTNLAAAVN